VGHIPNPVPHIPHPDMIRILITGGTFDKEYDEIAGTLFFKDTHVPDMLRLG
jgi:L-asparaginase